MLDHHGPGGEAEADPDRLHQDLQPPGGGRAGQQHLRFGGGWERTCKSSKWTTLVDLAAFCRRLRSHFSSSSFRGLSFAYVLPPFACFRMAASTLGVV